MESEFRQEAKVLMTISGLFLFGFTLSSVFTDIFIFKLIDDLKIVSIYSICRYAGLLIFFPFGSYIGKKKDLGLVLKTALVAHAIFYLSIILLGDYTKNFLYVLGFIFGFAQAFYYVAMNQLSIEVTTAENRSKFLAISGIINSVAIIIPPIIAGILIRSFKGLTGYYFMFGVTLIIFGAAGFLSRGLTVKCRYKNFNFWYSVTIYRKEWFLLNVAHFIVGLRDGVVAFLINIVVYRTASSNENDVGMFAAVSATLVTLTYMITVKFIRKENTLKYMKNINWLMILAPLCLFLFKNKFGIYGYAIFNSIATPALSIGLVSIAYAIIEVYSKKYRQIEYLAVREVYSNAGRVLGIFLFILVSKKIDSPMIMYFVMALNCCYMVAYIIYAKVYKSMNKSLVYKYMKKLRLPIRRDVR
ncbi:MAG: hypothetical protein ACRCSK_00490 [Fusobacteriaceae bacterium]